MSSPRATLGWKPQLEHIKPFRETNALSNVHVAKMLAILDY
jgi:hypothetical protein